MTTSQYRVHSPAAIAGGAVAALGAIALLVRDGLTTGFTIDHALMPIPVGLTILTGHLAGRAFREWRPVAAMFFFLISIFGSAYVVYETTGRRAEVRDTKVATAVADNLDRDQLQRDLARATKRKADAEAAADRETSDGGCRTKCSDWKLRAQEVQANIDSLRAKLKGAGPERPVDPKAERVAAALALFGVPESAAKQAVATAEPVALPLLFELSAIFLFGYGFGHPKRSTTREDARARAPAATVEPVPAVSALELIIEPGTTDEDLEDLRKKLVGIGRAVTNDELAVILGRSKATASKLTSRAVEAGMVSRERRGREVAISLTKH